MDDKQHTPSNEELIFSLWLSGVPGLGNVTINRLLDALGSAENIYKADRYTLSNVKGIGAERIAQILSHKDLDFARETLDQCRRFGIQIILYGTSNPLLKRLFDMGEERPAFMYARGNIKRAMDSAASMKSVGIIGPRRCTQRQKWNAEKVTQEYVRDGFTVISGMAKGIDAYAHTACINSGGYTIAVLGNGLDLCYPSEHQPLMSAIIDQGLLLSEYPPGTKPTRYHFPLRNRLIATLSDVLVVISPGERSGTQSTVAYAAKIGRQINILTENCEEFV